MVEQLFKDVYVRERLLAGPMGAYLDVLSSKLLQLGYSHAQARKLVRTASALGFWLAEQGLAPADAGKKELLAYMAKQKRTPAGRLLEGAIGFSRLPLLLESEGVLCKPGYKRREKWPARRLDHAVPTFATDYRERVVDVV